MIAHNLLALLTISNDIC